MRRIECLAVAALATVALPGAVRAQQPQPTPQPFAVGNALGLPVTPTATGTFEYSNISPEIYRRLMTSPTPASYYHESIEEEFTPRRIK